MTIVMRALNEAASCEAAATAIDEGMEILYGGLRPLPTLPPGSADEAAAFEQTAKAHELVGEQEMEFAVALESYAMKGPCAGERGRALDLKLFVEQMNEVASALAEFTALCGDGSRLDAAPCDNLQPLLDRETGHEIPVASQVNMIQSDHSLELRSPHVFPWVGVWEEDVVITKPIAAGECAVIPKETRGLMVRLRLERVTVVRDPWVATFGAPRGTLVPVWTLEWVPSQYLKEWNICNVGGQIRTTVTQRVKQDIPLNYFWRFYPRTG